MPLDADEAANRRQVPDDTRERVIVVTEPREVAALAVEAARVREQVPDAHIRRPGPGTGVEVEERERERRRERLRHGRDAEGRVRVAPDRRRLIASVDPQARGERGHAQRSAAASHVAWKYRLDQGLLPYFAARPGLRVLPSRVAGTR